MRTRITAADVPQTIRILPGPPALRERREVSGFVYRIRRPRWAFWRKPVTVFVPEREYYLLEEIER